MPTYKTNGSVWINGVMYDHDSSVTLAPGALCDELLTAQAIYRPDIGPGYPRGYWSPMVLLPVQNLVYPPRHSDPVQVPIVNGVPLGIDPTYLASLISRYETETRPYYLPIDEWAIPDVSWPPPGGLQVWRYWRLFPENMAPARGFRLIR